MRLTQTLELLKIKELPSKLERQHFYTHLSEESIQEIIINRRSHHAINHIKLSSSIRS